MERILEDKIKFNKIIGEGAESYVYDAYNGKAYKRFLYHTMRETLKNKENKLKLINDKSLEGFVKPYELVFDIQGFRGYTMEKIDSTTTVYDVVADENKTLKEKIEILKKMENNIKTAHNNDVLLIDLNLKNFVIDNNNIKGVDIDNFMVGGYEADCLPSATYDYYLDVVSKNIDENMDKFAFAINSLLILADQSVTIWDIYRKKYEKVNELLESLDIPNNFKNYYYELLKSNNDKVFLSEVIDEISSEDAFIKKK